MDYNLHTHTYRCSHATGTEREYIEAAISAGIKIMGFSDHIPFKFPDGEEYFYRVPMAQAREYIDTINSLKEEYKGQIELHVGFEVEYYPEHFEEMVRAAHRWGAEYLILGQHSVGKHPNIHWSTMKTSNEELLKEYVQCIVLGIKSRVFTYVAHPDIMNFTGDEKLYDEEMRKICKESKECGVPLEINFLGIRDMRNYPCEKFWKIAGEENSPVVFGLDAHNVSGAKDLNSLKTAEEICKRYNLNLLKMPKLVNLERK